MATHAPVLRATMTCTSSLRRVLLAILLAGFAAGCNTVEYYEMRAFSDPAMEFEDGATETHWFQKVHYSIEGSAGGIGTSAGGGCGCY